MGAVMTAAEALLPERLTRIRSDPPRLHGRLAAPAVVLSVLLFVTLNALGDYPQSLE